MPGKENFEGTYREAVGGVLWNANTMRLDISNAVPGVARRSHDPSVKQ